MHERETRKPRFWPRQRNTALEYAAWVPGAAGYAREVVLADAGSPFAAAADLQRPNRDYGFAGADDTRL